MLAREELSNRLAVLKSRAEEIRGIFDPERKRAELERIEQDLSRPGLWNDPAAAQSLSQRRRALAGDLERCERLMAAISDADALLELAAEGEEVEADLRNAVSGVERELEQSETLVLLDGEYDNNNAIVAIHPGAGGTESQDWAEMLLRMYQRWAERRQFQVELVDLLPGEEAGIKSATFTVNGPWAYGYLRGEKGVHRLVRISPYDAAARRHTSFASVDVIPEVDDSIKIDINDRDLRIDTYRSSGAGGQHVNVTDSAVRITHIPTGIVVQCQNERSQHRNKDVAMRILRARLYERELSLREEKRRVEEGAKGESSFGSQIRSYVLQPYRLIKDHRTGLEIGDVDRVLDGDIDRLIRATLLSRTHST
ncbi:MAG: peptide chain release factor 2 [Acidobacteria bacterium]|nr:MAG: peptide chain release factor 2 [Acidobacteriota bacterium]